MSCRSPFLFSYSHIKSLSKTFFFFFNDTATTEIYTLSLHDALPISVVQEGQFAQALGQDLVAELMVLREDFRRSEEHTSELQSRQYLVCRLLLEKKKKKNFLPILHAYNLPRTDKLLVQHIQ